jgi:hypothetical protein
MLSFLSVAKGVQRRGKSLCKWSSAAVNTYRNYAHMVLVRLGSRLSNRTPSVANTQR